MSSFLSSSGSTASPRSRMVSFSGGGGPSAGASRAVSSDNSVVERKEPSPDIDKPMSRLLFSESAPFDVLMQRFTELRASDPDAAQAIFMQGNELVMLAAKGMLGQLRSRVAEIRDEIGIYPFFGSKMLQQSLSHGHLLVAKFVIDNGFPIRSHAYPSHLHLALETVEDHLGIAIVNFMASQGIDINRQVKGTWETALHVAVRRSLPGTVSALVESGADVNAVAENDVMPLKLALQLSSNHGLESQIAVELRNRGAVETLDLLLTRSRVSDSTSSSVGFTTNSSVSFKSICTEFRGPHAQIAGLNCEAESKPKYVRFSGGDVATARDNPQVVDEKVGKSSDDSYIFSTGNSEF